MCINLETSIISFIIGELYGFKIYKSNKKEYKVLGIFIMWYSLVQFIEACIYYFGTKWYKIFNKTLVICLGLQGLVIFYTHQKIFNQSHILFFVTLLISIILTYKSINDELVIKNSKCVDWNFFEHNRYISVLLFWMYISILILLSINNKYKIFRNYLLFTYFISNFIISNKNTPSMWCLTSAIITPIYYYKHVI